jgi:hypothetical protein
MRVPRGDSKFVGCTDQEHLTPIANKLCMEAFRRGSMDNITVVIILAISDKSDGGGHSSMVHQNGGGRFSNHRNHDREIDSLNDGSLASLTKQKSALSRKSGLASMMGGSADVRQSAGAVDLLRQRRDGSNSVVGRCACIYELAYTNRCEQVCMHIRTVVGRCACIYELACRECVCVLGIGAFVTKCFAAATAAWGND